MLNPKMENRSQMEFFCVDEFVPQDHLLRKIDRVVDFSHIYDLMEELYCPDNGRPSCDPVVLFKWSSSSICTESVRFAELSMRST